MTFKIVSERKRVPISGRREMQISTLVEFWFEVLHLGYRIVDTRGGYVSHNGKYRNERSYEVTVNASRSVLPKLKLLARSIARRADQEEVRIEYRGRTIKITRRILSLPLAGRRTRKDDWGTQLRRNYALLRGHQRSHERRLA